MINGPKATEWINNYMVKTTKYLSELIEYTMHTLKNYISNGLFVLMEDKHLNTRC
mgnify:CR=1 FL=1